MTKVPSKRRNPIAQDLRTAKYKKRVLRDRSKYTRKQKHTNRGKDLGSSLQHKPCLFWKEEVTRVGFLTERAMHVSLREPSGSK